MRTLRHAARRSAAAPAHAISRQQQRTAATRAKLLTAAQFIFARDGFEASRLEDIAARAGFTRGAFYANFDSKEDLLFALMERVITEKVDSIHALLDRCQSPHERLQALREYYTSLAGDRSWVLLLLEFKLFALRHPQARARLVERYRKLRAPGRDLLESLVRNLSGTLPISSNATTIALGALSNALLIENLLDPKALKPDEIHFLLRMFFDALIGKPARL